MADVNLSLENISQGLLVEEFDDALRLIREGAGRAELMGKPRVIDIKITVTPDGDFFGVTSELKLKLPTVRRKSQAWVDGDEVMTHEFEASETRELDFNGRGRQSKVSRLADRRD